MWLRIFTCVWFGFFVTEASPLPKDYKIIQYQNHPAVKRFREYTQIDTSRDENLKDAVAFWQRQAAELGLSFAVHRPAGKPVCVMTWKGEDPSLPSIMLNSHMDVVPADPLGWIYPPFSAHIDEDGNIYGRGTQDDKDISLQYVEAIRKLKNENITLQRTVHVTFMPDRTTYDNSCTYLYATFSMRVQLAPMKPIEEIVDEIVFEHYIRTYAGLIYMNFTDEETGGFKGMLPFVNTTDFSALNVGFAMDEGMATSDDNYIAFYQDKKPWILRYTVYGEGGHGISMPEESAMEKAQRLINMIMAWRDEQKRIMKTTPSDYGAYNSVNINVINGGLAANVIPTSITLMVDIRLALTITNDELLAQAEKWQEKSGNGTRMEFVRHVTESAATPVGDDYWYWVGLRDAISDMGRTITPSLCPAATDMIPLRNRGIPCIGFSPKTNTYSRIHTSNEYLNAATFLKGIDVYVEILKKLGNVVNPSVTFNI